MSNRLTLVVLSRAAVCDLLAGFSDFYLPFSNLTLAMKGIPSSYRVHIWCGKTRTAGLRSRECRKGCLGTIHQRDRHTERQTATQPRRHSKCRFKASGGKNNYLLTYIFPIKCSCYCLVTDAGGAHMGAK